VEEIRVRVPTPADGPEIGRVQVQAWKRAYVGLMALEFLAGLDEVERGEAWHQRLVARERRRTEPEVEFLVAERGGELLGMATVGPDRDHPGGSEGELRMINVTPRAWGTGVGPALLDAAEVRLCALGFETAVLWVVTGNTRARRFYERQGWRPDGTRRTLEIGGYPVPEWRYHRHLVHRSASSAA
jgi:GNAT superfamily N-acetyltransferase